MASPDLLRKIATAPAGISAERFRASDLKVARDEGLIEFTQHGPSRFVRLSDEGRKALSLPPRKLGFFARLKDRFTWR